MTPRKAATPTAGRRAPAKVDGGKGALEPARRATGAKRAAPKGGQASPVPLRVGVLMVQGAAGEHVDAVRRAAERAGREVEVVPVRTAAQLEACSGLVIPGGESTTISRLLRSGGLQAPLVERARSGDLALFGTCAGLILLCSDATRDVADKDIELLGLLDCRVDRNAFGRQRDSFEARLDVEGVGSVPAVFIRAPKVVEARAPTEVLARFGDGVVAVRKGRILGTAFHPELTQDTRLHEWFLRLCEKPDA
ncbi:MAG TPA: pyridoxal 5'-phosphate synthase glutaminase subunit PdxT [Candidatus Thermoplasmatota archaeon]|nr:pyridoxal 5'-phosphate synthase glutaminase subunit PdxT [Candidatus Thermoplasmatota archaeon]